jgi:hypothetical protein
MRFEGAITDFYASLHSPPIPTLEVSIKEPTLRRRVRSELCHRICSYYEQLYQSIQDPVLGGYEPTMTTSLLENYPLQVRTLFLV